jgi:hypothetical protein
MIEPFSPTYNAPAVPWLLRRGRVLQLGFYLLMCIAIVFLFAGSGITAEPSPVSVSFAYMVDQSTDIVAVNASAVSVEQHTKHIQGGPPYQWNVYHVKVAETLKPFAGSRVKKGSASREMEISFYDEKAINVLQAQHENGLQKTTLFPLYKTSVTDVVQELKTGGLVFFLQQRDGVYFLQNPGGFESLTVSSRVKELIKASETESDSGCVQN